MEFTPIILGIPDLCFIGSYRKFTNLDQLSYFAVGGVCEKARKDPKGFNQQVYGIPRDILSGPVVILDGELQRNPNIFTKEKDWLGHI